MCVSIFSTASYHHLALFLGHLATIASRIDFADDEVIPPSLHYDAAAAFRSLRRAMKGLAASPQALLQHEFFAPLRLRPAKCNESNVLAMAISGEDGVAALFEALRQPDTHTLLHAGGLARACRVTPRGRCDIV